MADEGQASALSLAKVDRLLVVRLGRLGDLLTASWLFKEIKAAYPILKLSLLTLPGCGDLLRYNRDLDEVHFYRRWMPLESLAWMRLRRFQALVDLNDAASRTSTLLCRLSGVGSRAAFYFEKNRARYTVAVPAPPPESSHILERLAVMARALGLNPRADQVRPFLALGQAQLDRARAHLRASRRAPGPLVAFNLSAGQPSRLWTGQGWAELARRLLSSNPGLEIVVLCAPKDRKEAARLAAEVDPARMILGQGSGFHDFAAYIHEAGLLISPDTSAIHVASAFSRPVLGLYPRVAWNLASWRPYGTRCEIIQSASGDAGEFDPAEVFGKAAAMLKA